MGWLGRKELATITQTCVLPRRKEEHELSIGIYAPPFSWRALNEPSNREPKYPPFPLKLFVVFCHSNQESHKYTRIFRTESVWASLSKCKMKAVGPWVSVWKLQLELWVTAQNRHDSVLQSLSKLPLELNFCERWAPQNWYSIRRKSWTRAFGSYS